VDTECSGRFTTQMERDAGVKGHASIYRVIYIRDNDKPRFVALKELAERGEDYDNDGGPGRGKGPGPRAAVRKRTKTTAKKKDCYSWTILRPPSSVMIAFRKPVSGSGNPSLFIGQPWMGGKFFRISNSHVCINLKALGADCFLWLAIKHAMSGILRE